MRPYEEVCDQRAETREDDIDDKIAFHDPSKPSKPTRSDARSVVEFPRAFLLTERRTS